MSATHHALWLAGGLRSTASAPAGYSCAWPPLAVEPRLQAWPSAITLSDMGKRTAVYEVVDAATREALSRHRTRQAALDAWRLEFPGRRVRVERRGIPNEHVLIVEGVWHESIRRT
jgi:hypothetical protein